jgi:hypothetical protein
VPRDRRRDDDDFDDGDEDDRDERPRRRKREEEGDETGGLIPYKNSKALAAYYIGVFSLIPCLAVVLGPTAVVLGFLGLRYAKEHPKAKGKAHAIVGIVLGGITTLLHVGGVVVLLVAGFLADKR